MQGPSVAIRRIIQARCRLYGLTGQKSGLAPSRPRTVVLTEEELAELRGWWVEDQRMMRVQVADPRPRVTS